MLTSIIKLKFERKERGREGKRGRGKEREKYINVREKH